MATVRVVQHAGGAAALRAQPAVHAARQAAPRQRDDVAPRDARPAVTTRPDPAAPRPLACRTHPCRSRRPWDRYGDRRNAILRCSAPGGTRVGGAPPQAAPQTTKRRPETATGRDAPHPRARRMPVNR
eukprot:scaffold9483_cov59-Phaeocystis_antarctica.AAC.3